MDTGPDEPFGQAAVAGFRHAPYMTFVTIGPDLVVGAYNDALRAFVGDRPVGTLMSEEFPELAHQQQAELYAEVWRTGAPRTAREWRIQLNRPEGGLQEAYLDMTVSPWRDETGAMVGTVATAVDVTEAVLARRAVQEQRDSLGVQLREARSLVRTMQDALLPYALPVVPRLDVAANYLLATDDATAGGDWFDAVVRPDGPVALVVGDVVGHGVTASATMGRLRAVLRERLLDRGSIADALERLDAYVASGSEPEGVATTLCVAQVDPATGEVEYCTAGHPPPLLVADGTSQHLAPSAAGPLGSGSGFACERISIPTDAVLVLFSDGLVERPGRSPAESTVEIARTVEDAVANVALPLGAPSRTSVRVCEQALELLTRRTGYGDDITILAAQRVLGITPFTWAGPALRRAVRDVREALAHWLRAWEVRPLDEVVVQHAVGELVANVVEHAYLGGPPGELHVDVDVEPDGVLVASVRDHGRWRSPRQSDGRGRGLALVQRLADALEVDPGEAATTATVRVRLTRAAQLLEGSQGGVDVESGATPDTLLFERGERLRVSGPVDLLTASRFEAELQRVSRGGTAEHVVDLSGVTFLGSTGVRVLVENRFEGVRLYAPPGSVAQHVLELVHLPHVSDLGDDPDDEAHDTGPAGEPAT